MNKLLAVSTIILLAGCSTPPKYAVAPELQKDVVISRIDDLKERPEWIQESKPFRTDSDKVVSQGFSQIPSDHNLNAAYRVCFNNAKASIATAIEQKLEFIFQQSSEGTELDSTTAHFIGSEMSSLTTSSMRPTNQYYEKVASTQDSGERKTHFKVFCTTEMPMPDFKKNLYEAMRRAEGKGKISSDFKAKVDQQWQSFVNAPVSNKPEERQPTSSNE